MHLAPTYDISSLNWLPVGPFEDPHTHLIAPFQFGTCPMALHAVEVLYDRENMLVAKSELLEHILFAVEMIAAGGMYHRAVMEGRTYLLVAMPCPSPEVPS